jgi:hypothetical protein
MNIPYQLVEEIIDWYCLFEDKRRQIQKTKINKFIVEQIKIIRENCNQFNYNFIDIDDLLLGEKEEYSFHEYALTFHNRH